MNTIAPELDLMSTGKLAELLQASPNRIERACEQAHIEPAIRLNGLNYYRDADVEAIRGQLSLRKESSR